MVYYKRELIVEFPWRFMFLTATYVVYRYKNYCYISMATMLISVSCLDARVIQTYVIACDEYV
jgi:hypothetical protein